MRLPPIVRFFRDIAVAIAGFMVFVYTLIYCLIWASSHYPLFFIIAVASAFAIILIAALIGLYKESYRGR